MTRARLSTSTSVASLVALLLTACGGTNGTPGDPASNGAVSISPQSAALPPNGQQPFTATVSALVDTSVTWRVREVGGGQVNASGLYTAPNGSGIFHVEVASAADPTKFAVAVVTVSGVGSGIEGLHVVGNQIRNAAGQEVRIHGVNRAGTEYACIQGWGFFDGPSDAASLQAIRSWKANAVRIPLNEDCWLGINGVAPAYGGQNYQRAIADYVALVTQQGLVAILDLHWSAPGTTRADAQRPMPDRDHSPTFWSQVANAFKGNSSVIFELFNEPYPDSNQDTTAAWTCWRDGGACPGVGFTAAGMQELVYAVRDAGATNVILLSGVQYSNTLTRWMEFKPHDPLNNMGAVWHVYNFNICASVSCYDRNTGPVLASYPVVATEIGQDNCGGDFIAPLMGWLDSHGGGYVAWVWNTWGSCLALISDYQGTARGTYGQTYRDHLVAITP